MPAVRAASCGLVQGWACSCWASTPAPACAATGRPAWRAGCWAAQRVQRRGQQQPPQQRQADHGSGGAHQGLLARGQFVPGGLQGGGGGCGAVMGLVHLPGLGLFAHDQGAVFQAQLVAGGAGTGLGVGQVGVLGQVQARRRSSPAPKSMALACACGQGLGGGGEQTSRSRGARPPAPGATGPVRAPSAGGIDHTLTCGKSLREALCAQQRFWRPASGVPARPRR